MIKYIDKNTYIGFDRALIVQSPHIDNILDNGKTWEMRSKITHVRGTVGLIESGTGLIKGSVEIIHCINKPIENAKWHINKHQVHDLSLLDKWCYAWVLSNAKRFDKPIPYKHPKGAVVWVKI